MIGALHMSRSSGSHHCHLQHVRVQQNSEWFDVLYFLYRLTQVILEYWPLKENLLRLMEFAEVGFFYKLDALPVASFSKPSSMSY